MNISGFMVMSKRFSRYKTANRLGIDAKEHKCKINWDGSSVAICTRVASDLCIKMHNEEYDVCIQHTVSDDDSTMRAHLLHESNGGKLSEHILPPNFPVDPSH